MSKRVILVALLSLGFVAPAAIADAAQSTKGRPAGINARQTRQADRIKDGVKNQELTKGELDKLKADEASIRAEERVYRNSGNGLNNAERRDLEQDLNRSSRQIYRLKHNDRVPAGGGK